jgi:hypothetical protein
MVWDGNGDGGTIKPLLHDKMAASLPHEFESMSLKDLADIPPG